MDPKTNKLESQPLPTPAEEDISQEQPEFVARFLEENCDCTTRAFSVIGQLSKAIKDREAAGDTKPDKQ